MKTYIVTFEVETDDYGVQPASMEYRAPDLDTAYEMVNREFPELSILAIFPATEITE